MENLLFKKKRKVPVEECNPDYEDCYFQTWFEKSFDDTISKFCPAVINSPEIEQY